MKISFLMMAKNSGRYLAEAIMALQVADESNWELIIVDDSSDDDTYAIASSFSASDPRVYVYRNPHRGVVRGTSFAFEKCSGEVIKCIDSDDVLSKDFFHLAKLHVFHDVIFHSAEVVDQDLRYLSKYFPNPFWLLANEIEVAENLVSLPKWCWSFHRSLAKLVFPLPEDLPIEDVWMSIVLKHYSTSPKFIDEPVYKYRQHNTQLWGGMLNYSRAVTIKRSRLILGVISSLERYGRTVSSDSLDFSRISFEKSKRLHHFLVGDGCLSDYWNSRCSWTELVRAFLLRYFPYPLPVLAKLKWYLAKFLGGAR